MPPASLLGLSELSGFDIRLTPASKVWDWLQAEILADTGSIHNEDHAHLIDADICVMWASAAFSKKGRTVVGQAEQVAFRAGGWQKARMEQQMFDWFGCLPTYIITQPVTSLPSVNRGSLSADRAGGHQEQTGMSHAIISSIYEVKLIAWNAARSEKLKIVFENTAYTPAAGETYLRAFTIPGDTASNTLGGDHRLFTGVFQVSIIAPAGTGKENTNPVAAELTDLFPLYARDTKGDVTVVTMSPVESAPGITGDSTYTAPVSFMSQQAVAARPGHV